MNTLQNIYFTLCKQGYCSDKNTVHSYLDVYAELLEPYRKGNCLEIGLFKGDSLRMWESYFEGEVWGIDCSETPHGGLADLRPMIASNEHNILIFDAENEAVVFEYFEGKKFDVIIEDAGHDLSQQRNMYRIWKEYLNHGGIYIIEDVQDIDKHRDAFLNLGLVYGKDVDIIDRRSVKGRYDDVIVLIKDKI